VWFNEYNVPNTIVTHKIAVQIKTTNAHGGIFPLSTPIAEAASWGEGVVGLVNDIRVGGLVDSGADGPVPNAPPGTTDGGVGMPPKSTFFDSMDDT